MVWLEGNVTEYDHDCHEERSTWFLAGFGFGRLRLRKTLSAGCNVFCYRGIEEPSWNFVS